MFLVNVFVIFFVNIFVIFFVIIFAVFFVTMLVINITTFDIRYWPTLWASFLSALRTRSFTFYILMLARSIVFFKPRKFCFTFFLPPPKYIYICPGCLFGSIGSTFRPLSHPSTRQLQVPSIPIPMISNHHHHESAGRPVRSSIAASRWRYAAKNWFDKL